MFKIMMKDLYDEEYYKTFSDVKNRTAIIEGKFIFALIWSFGATANTNSRKKFETEVKRLLSGDIKIANYDKRKLTYPERGSIYDYNYTPKKACSGCHPLMG